MQFTEKEKTLAKELKEAGLPWDPKEGDFFWAAEDVSHQFYLGESLPSSFFFRKGETYVFDSAMTWHLQQAGLTLEKFVWLPSWPQCRSFLKKAEFQLKLSEQPEEISIEAGNSTQKFTASGKTDLEALYTILSEILKAVS